MEIILQRGIYRIVKSFKGYEIHFYSFNCWFLAYKLDSLAVAYSLFYKLLNGEIKLKYFNIFED